VFSQPPIEPIDERLSRDEARIEAEDEQIRDTRIVAWLGVALALTLVAAITALGISLAALNDSVDSGRLTAVPGSVGTAAIQDGAVTREKLAPASVDHPRLTAHAVETVNLAPNAVTGAQVARNSLTGADIRERSLAKVPQAADADRLGGLSADAFLSRVVDIAESTATSTSATKGPLTARCPSGTRVISGGAVITGARTGAALTANGPDGTSGWTAQAALDADPAPAWGLTVHAICAAGGR
jgi:hypothetical protein